MSARCAPATATCRHEPWPRRSNPASPDRLNFTDGEQPLVDAAFLAQAVLVRRRCCSRAASTRRRAGVLSRRLKPRGHPPWLQQLAAVCGDGRSRAQGARRLLGPHARGLRATAARAVVSRRRRASDGPAFHWDYYNSFVIHPMLVDVLGAVGDVHPAWTTFRTKRRVRRGMRACWSASSHPTLAAPAAGPIDCLPVRCVPIAGAGGLAAHASRRRAPAQGRSPHRSHRARTPSTPTAG